MPDPADEVKNAILSLPSLHPLTFFNVPNFSLRLSLRPHIRFVYDTACDNRAANLSFHSYRGTPQKSGLKRESPLKPPTLN